MLAQEGALGELVQQHLMAKGKLGTIQRQHKSKLLFAKKNASANGTNGNTNGTTERSPQVKRRRHGPGGGRKKSRKKK
jgi:hypothetical protein